MFPFDSMAFQEVDRIWNSTLTKQLLWRQAQPTLSNALA